MIDTRPLPQTLLLPLPRPRRSFDRGHQVQGAAQAAAALGGAGPGAARRYHYTVHRRRIITLGQTSSSAEFYEDTA